MKALIFFRSLAILCTGLAAGVFLGHWRGISVAMPDLDLSSFVQLQQIVHVHFVPLMPILLFGAAVTSIIWAFFLRKSRKKAGFRLVFGSAVAMTLVLLLTLIINVPINNNLMTWSIETPPPDLMKLWRPWEISHSIRTLLALAAFACQSLALSIRTATDSQNDS